MTETNEGRRWHLACGMAWPWLIAVVLMTCFIWGNSMVPGEGSGSLSKAALAVLQGCMDGLGVPSGWLTEHIVRKTAHFTEYLVLALLAMQAFRPHRRDRDADGSTAGAGGWTRGRVVRAVACAALLVAVPSIDETIQTLTPDRGPSVADVALDCCGAATGALLTTLASCLARRRSGTR